MNLVTPSFTRRQQNTNLFYCISPATYMQFIAYLWNGTFIDDIAKLTSNPLDAIISAKVYPFSPPALDVDNTIGADSIKLGNIDYTGYGDVPTVTAEILFADYSPICTFETGLDIQPLYNNFLDYAPFTDITLYIPYVGFESVNPYDVMGKNVNVRYVVDFASGLADVYLIATDTEGEERILNTYQATLGFEIPITGSNRSDVLLNTLTGGINILATIFKSPFQSVGGTVSGITNTLKDMLIYPDKSYIGSTSKQMSALYSPNQLSAIIKRPNAIIGDDFAPLRGRPLGEVRTLGDLTGFTVVDDIHVEGLASATQDEQTEIERLLKSGVIL